MAATTDTPTSFTDKPADHADPPLTPDERNAMRAFLQRSEVRLSTLHRIATAFISGAGLLILFPVFFKEEIVAILRIFLSHAGDAMPYFGANEGLLRGLLFVFLAYPFFLSFSLPIYSMYLLIKDVIHFYYTIYTPGFPSTLITPSFALSGLAFSPDESKTVKKQVFQYQYHPASINFAIPFSREKRELYFEEAIRNTDGDILPKSRCYDELLSMGAIPENTDRRSVEHVNAAFGLARTLDRQLSEEVATTELSIARHILYLRRLVMRYVRTLIMFIWTALITFMLLPFLEDQRLPTFLVMAVGFLIWSALTIPLMRMPLRWIYRHREEMPDNHHIDRQLITLETQMRPLVIGAIITSLIAIALSIPLYAA